MEKIVERNMLYDFYGELLTPHQQEIYESIIFQDLSLSEVAEIHCPGSGNQQAGSS